MRAGTPTVDVLVEGMDLNSREKGAFIQNMFRRERSWQTRHGFGQLGQFDSTLGLPASGTNEQGYRTCLGCECIRTREGALQAVSVWSNRAHTGDNESAGSWQNCLSLLVYDVKAGTWWEEVVHRKTSSLGRDVREMPDQLGVYATNETEEMGDFLSTDDARVWMHEHLDNLLFGNEKIGLWCYRPSDFAGNRRKQLDGVHQRANNKPYSESCALVEVSPVDGLFANAFPYLQSDTFPRPADASSLGDRLVMVSGREVFFSDFGRPGSVLGRNVLFVPANEDLLAVEVVNDHVLLWSANETWMYQPSLGDSVAKGRLVQLSQNVGCLGPRAVRRVGGVVYWMDRRGVWMTDGASEPVEVSEAIRPFFDSSISSPLHHYFAETGFSDLAEAQPRSFYDLSEPDGIHAAYHSQDELLLFTVPSISLTWVYHLPSKGWSVWTYESFANGDDPIEVEARQYLPSANLCARDDELFMWAGAEAYVTGDTIAPAVDAQPRSAILLQYGRGGGLDRSTDYREDNREWLGHYDRLQDTGANGIFWVGEPIRRDGTLNEKINRTSPPASDYYLFPVYLKPTATAGVGTDGVKLHFDFDNTEWTPVFVGATAELDFLLPQERWPSRAGWGYGAPVATRRVACTDGAGVNDATGSQIRVEFDGPTSGGGWTHANSLNLQPGQKNLLMFLPFTKDNASNDVSGLGPSLQLAEDRPAGGALTTCDVRFFQKMVGIRLDADQQAQAVDWCYQAPEIRSKDTGVRLRGALLRVLSHGAASSPIESTWIYGLLNMAIGSDWKTWSSQLIDYAGTGNGPTNISEVRSKTSLRSRYINSASSLAQVVFGTTGPTWGDTTDSSRGNVLVDDEAVDDIALSDHVKGQWVNLMLFGHIRSRAERIVLSSVDAIVQARGGRRRRGR